MNASFARTSDSDFLPHTFSELFPGDIFNTQGVQQFGLLGFTVTCLKLGNKESPKGNAVTAYGDESGRIIRIDPSAEVELISSSSSCRNWILEELRREKEG